MTPARLGVTPATFIVKRKPDLVVTISKDGYKTVTRKVVSKMKAKGGAALAGNVLVGGNMGIAADSITGATLNHKPNPLAVILVPVVPKTAEAQSEKAAIKPEEKIAAK